MKIVLIKKRQDRGDKTGASAITKAGGLPERNLLDSKVPTWQGTFKGPRKALLLSFYISFTGETDWLW